jgi:hypothetical protein
MHSPHDRSHVEFIRRSLTHETLVVRATRVFDALPHDVLRDLLDDPSFGLHEEDFVVGRGSRVWMAAPTSASRGSRSVVLRRRLVDCEEAFAHYIIAHELAHAYLWNGGWGDIADKEHAADALAASWGFVRPR